MTDLTAKVGPVDWEGLKQELMGLPNETLAEMVNLWLKTSWSNQNYWMVYTEAESGFATAGKLDGQVWHKVGAIQAFRLKKLLNLGDDVQALAPPCSSLPLLNGHRPVLSGKLTRLPKKNWA